MPRQLPRRTPAAAPPSAPATTPIPVFTTPPRFPQDVATIEEYAAGGQVATTAAAMPELGEETDVEDGHSDDEVRVIDFDALGEAQDDDDDVDVDVDVVGELDDEDIDGDDENEEIRRRQKSPSPIPPDLREISSLASWTVSTHKPGCGVAALRNPSPQQFWQSDGPQPHTLTLHFFKLVAIVKIRVYLDFDLDESYTPTKMLFFAGMGGNDLVEFAAWEGESPSGWVNIPLDGVGGSHRKRGYGRRRTQRARPSNTNGLDDFDGGEYDDDDDYNDSDDPYSGNVLKAMVVQVRICENHQNGKDTHVRGFQVFAHDDDRRRVAAAAAAASSQVGQKRQSVHKSHDGLAPIDDGLAEKIHALDEPDWMGEPVIR